MAAPHEPHSCITPVSHWLFTLQANRYGYCLHLQSQPDLVRTWRPSHVAQSGKRIGNTNPKEKSKGITSASPSYLQPHQPLKLINNQSCQGSKSQHTGSVCSERCLGQQPSHTLPLTYAMHPCFFASLLCPTSVHMVWDAGNRPG